MREDEEQRGKNEGPPGQSAQMSCTATAQRRTENASPHGEYIIIVILAGREKFVVLKYEARLLPYQLCGVRFSTPELEI